MIVFTSGWTRSANFQFLLYCELSRINQMRPYFLPLENSPLRLRTSRTLSLKIRLRQEPIRWWRFIPSFVKVIWPHRKLPRPLSRDFSVRKNTIYRLWEDSDLMNDSEKIRDLRRLFVRHYR